MGPASSHQCQLPSWVQEGSVALLGQVPCHTQPLCLMNTPGGRVRQGGDTALDKAERGARGQDLSFEERWGAAQPGVGAGAVVSTAPGGRAKTKRGPNRSHKSYH